MNIETTKAEIHELVDTTDYEVILNHTRAQFKRFKNIQEAHPKTEFTIGELELIDVILNGLSKKLLARYKKLSLKLLREEITEEEREELIEVNAQIEEFGVERLRNIIKLSESWHISVPEVMDKLKIKTPPALHA